MQTLATGALALVAILWLLRMQGALWRRSVWGDVGSDIHAVASELGGAVTPTWTGYRVVANGTCVEWWGGLWGFQTRVTHPFEDVTLRATYRSLLDQMSVKRALHDLNT